ncbi:MAG TPA: hypothetical protein PLC06_14430, partial [Promineifilum sp.]|nr:hypothetical protein [Promineifilum sp.]
MEACATFVLGSETGVKFSCFVNRLIRALMVLEQVDLSGEDSDLLIDLIAMSRDDATPVARLVTRHSLLSVPLTDGSRPQRNGRSRS